MYTHLFTTALFIMAQNQKKNIWFINENKQEWYSHTNKNYSTYEESGKRNPFFKGKILTEDKMTQILELSDKDLKAIMVITMK